MTDSPDRQEGGEVSDRSPKPLPTHTPLSTGDVNNNDDSDNGSLPSVTVRTFNPDDASGSRYGGSSQIDGRSPGSEADSALFEHSGAVRLPSADEAERIAREIFQETVAEQERAMKAEREAIFASLDLQPRRTKLPAPKFVPLKKAKEDRATKASADKTLDELFEDEFESSDGETDDDELIAQAQQKKKAVVERQQKELPRRHSYFDAQPAASKADTSETEESRTVAKADPQAMKRPASILRPSSVVAKKPTASIQPKSASVNHDTVDSDDFEIEDDLPSDKALANAKTSSGPALKLHSHPDLGHGASSSASSAVPARKPTAAVQPKPSAKKKAVQFVGLSGSGRILPTPSAPPPQPPKGIDNIDDDDDSEFQIADVVPVESPSASATPPPTSATPPPNPKSKATGQIVPRSHLKPSAVSKSPDPKPPQVDTSQPQERKAKLEQKAQPKRGALPQTLASKSEEAAAAAVRFNELLAQKQKRASLADVEIQFEEDDDERASLVSTGSSQSTPNAKRYGKPPGGKARRKSNALSGLEVTAVNDDDNDEEMAAVEGSNEVRQDSQLDFDNVFTEDMSPVPAPGEEGAAGKRRYVGGDRSFDDYGGAEASSKKSNSNKGNDGGRSELRQRTSSAKYRTSASATAEEAAGTEDAADKRTTSQTTTNPDKDGDEKPKLGFRDRLRTNGVGSCLRPLPTKVLAFFLVGLTLLLLAGFASFVFGIVKLSLKNDRWESIKRYNKAAAAFTRHGGDADYVRSLVPALVMDKEQYDGPYRAEGDPVPNASFTPHEQTIDLAGNTEDAETNGKSIFLRTDGEGFGPVSRYFFFMQGTRQVELLREGIPDQIHFVDNDYPKEALADQTQYTDQDEQHGSWHLRTICLVVRRSQKSRVGLNTDLVELDPSKKSCWYPFTHQRYSRDKPEAVEITLRLNTDPVLVVEEETHGSYRFDGETRRRRDINGGASLVIGVVIMVPVALLMLQVWAEISGRKRHREKQQKMIEGGARPRVIILR